MSYPVVRLGDYIDILSGFAFKSTEFVDCGIPVIKIKNITPPVVSLEDTSFVTDETAEQQKRYLLNYNDVLIALTGSHINQMASVVGRVARVKHDNPSLLNQRVGKIMIRDSYAACLEYIYYYLSQDSIKIQLASKAGGAANQANISPNDIKDLLVPFPNIRIQEKIASILSSYDGLIENNRKQIKLLEEAAQRLYKEWFVDLRFPGYENTPIVDGLPEGWKTGTLSDVARFVRGKVITKDQAVNGAVPVVAGGLEPAYYHNTANTVAPVVTVSGSGANAGFTRMYYENIFASDCSFVDNSGGNGVFFAYCFLKDEKTRIKALQKGSAQPHVYAKDLNAMELVIPDSTTIERFNKTVAPLFIKIGNCEKMMKDLGQARDRLLPKLMSGEMEI